MLLIEILKYSGLSLLAYLLGSIPFGHVLSTLFSGQDIRHQGSGNIGATNVLRLAGPKLGLLTLFLDMFKGALPVFMALKLIDTPWNIWGQSYASLVTICAVGGHLYPLYFGFKGGGKGVATAWGCFFVISPISAMITLLIFILVACISNRASVASLSGTVVLPFLVWSQTNLPMITLCSVLVSGFIIFRHRKNLVRLTQGAEPTIWGKTS